MPRITGQILAYVDPNGAIYRGNDAEGEAAVQWQPFAFA
jgi:hypothetical protein